AYRVAEKLHTQHDYFKKVDFFMAADLPFVFYVQRPPKDDPKYKDEIVAKFGPILRELRKLFEKEYATPLGLRRQLQPELYRMAILSTPGDYVENYARAMRLGEGGLRLSAAHYDPKWRIAVTYEDKITPLSQDEERRHAILHEFVHALQHMYGRAGMPKPVWYAEGLAELLAAGGPDDSKDLSRRPFPQQALRQFMAAMGQGGDLFVNSLQDLVTAEGPGYDDVLLRAAARAGGRVPVNRDEFVGMALAAFYTQSTLMVHFLHEAEGGKHRQGFFEYMKAVQAGESGWGTFTKAFPDVDPDQIESSFLEYFRKAASR
ncbi:MAG: hypothetical protein HY721_15310, partial [Planctomycetes bacterium]|nr:hypothetical protein [Planctomycetota bacterium]